MSLLVGTAIAGVALAERGQAQSPFRLEYTVEELGTGRFDYEFDLILDNADASWSPGQEFDWFVFGDVPSGQSSPLTDWTFDPARSDPSLQTLTFSQGGHNGPTVGYGASAQLPGYAPMAIGDTLEWAGTATSRAEAIAWSNLSFSPGATRANFEAARQVEAESTSIPERSSAIAILGVGVVIAAKIWQTAIAQPHRRR